MPNVTIHAVLSLPSIFNLNLVFKLILTLRYHIVCRVVNFKDIQPFTSFTIDTKASFDLPSIEVNCMKVYAANSGFHFFIFRLRFSSWKICDR